MVRNVFADEWRACLGAHYVHVLAEGDLRNAESLRALLLKAEYSETDVAALEEYVRAELGVALSGASEVEKAEAEAQSEAAAPEAVPEVLNVVAVLAQTNVSAPETEVEEISAAELAEYATLPTQPTRKKQRRAEQQNLF